MSFGYSWELDLKSKVLYDMDLSSNIIELTPSMKF